MKIHRLPIYLTYLFVLASCGGGGGSANTAATTIGPLTKYIGTHVGACDNHKRSRLTVAAYGATSVSLRYISEYFQSSNCDGAVVGIMNFSEPLIASFVLTETAKVTGYPGTSATEIYPVDRVNLYAPPITITVTGTGVTNLTGQPCVAYDGGRTCIDTNGQSGLNIVGGIAIRGAEIVVLKADQTGYSVDSAFDGGGTVVSSTDPATPPTSAVPQVNAAVAFADLLSRSQAIAPIPSADGSQTRAGILFGTEQSAPFVANGVTSAETILKRIQLQITDTKTSILVSQAVWINYINKNNSQLVGVAMGFNYLNYPTCFVSAASSSFPTSTKSSGVWANGYSDGSFSETFRAGTYAHYCDYGTTSPVSYEWSIEAGSQQPYFCLTNPASLVFVKTKLCFMVDQSSKLTGSAWVRLYKSTGEVLAEYK